VTPNSQLQPGKPVAKFAWLGVVVAVALSSGSLRAASLLLTNAVVHTVTQGVLQPGSVRIEDGKITAVSAAIDAPADRTIDLAGRHLYPGLMAAGTSLGLVEIGLVRATRDFTEVGEYTPDVRSWTAVNPDSELLPVARANGITHIVPVPSGGIVSGHSGVVALHGWTITEMVIQKPAALHLQWPGMALDLRPKHQWPDPARWKSLEEQAKARRAKIREIDEFFAEAATYAKRKDAGDSAVPAWEAMRPFVSGQIPLVVLADEERQIRRAVEWGVSNKFRIAISGGRDAGRTASLLASNNIPVLFERVLNEGSDGDATAARDTDSYDVHYATPAVLHRAGVKLILGHGAGGDPAANVRNLPHTVGQAIAFGLPEDAALRSVTLHPAELFGVADRLGSIEPGKEATLFAADGDIFDVRTRVTSLWFRGESVPLDTRHTRLYEKYKNRPRPD